MKDLQHIEKSIFEAIDYFEEVEATVYHHKVIDDLRTSLTKVKKLNLGVVSNLLPTGDEIWVKANEISRDNFSDWFDKLVGNDC